MKNQNFIKRFKFSIRGLGYAWESEKSFRSQIVMTVLLLIILILLRPSLLWFSLFVVVIGATVAAELLNTALEYMIDFLHPKIHPQIGKAKDCAAAAVLVLSLSAIIIFIIFIYDKFFIINKN